MAAPSADEIRLVAKKATAVFTNAGLSCCLFGSAGCSLYGLSRKPNDVDIVVMTSRYDTEFLKNYLTAQDAAFYTRPAKTPGATYRVLFARLKANMHASKRSCKVDILIPGVMEIPNIESHRILRINELPVMPIIALLLLKLQGWSDHRAHTRLDMQQKQYVDIRDINQLLQIAVDRGDTLQQSTWLPRSFVTAGQGRLDRYLTITRPASFSSWQTIGFDISALDS